MLVIERAADSAAAALGANKSAKNGAQTKTARQYSTGTPAPLVIGPGENRKDQEVCQVINDTVTLVYRLANLEGAKRQTAGFAAPSPKATAQQTSVPNLA